MIEVDRIDAGQREIALAVLGIADLAFDGVAGAKPEAADLVRRDVDVVGPGEVVGFGGAQEAEAVWQHLDGARADDLLALLGRGLEDREEQVLLAKRRGGLDTERFRHRDKVGGRFALELMQMHGNVS